MENYQDTYRRINLFVHDVEFFCTLKFGKHQMNGCIIVRRKRMDRIPQYMDRLLIDSPMIWVVLINNNKTQQRIIQMLDERMKEHAISQI